MTKLLIADDHAIVRLGLNMLINDMLGDSCTITEASNGEQVLRQLNTSLFDILITDMNMPQPSGFTLLEKVRDLQPDLKVLVISVNAEELFAMKVLRAGAYGFITKNAESDELRKALRSALQGQPYFPSGFRNMPVATEEYGEKKNNPFKKLSARELEVTLQLLKGKGVLEMSNALAIKPSTTSTLKARIFKKLEVHSSLELDRLARYYGVIKDC